MSKPEGEPPGRVSPKARRAEPGRPLPLARREGPRCAKHKAGQALGLRISPETTLTARSPSAQRRATIARTCRPRETVRRSALRHSGRRWLLRAMDAPRCPESSRQESNFAAAVRAATVVLTEASLRALALGALAMQGS